MDTELTDDQWKVIRPLIPAQGRMGRPRADDRQVLNGILYVLRSGCRWKDLPRKFGHPSTCWRRVYGKIGPREYGVIREEPEFLPLEEQTELFAQRIKNLGRFQFLLRPAVAEGHIGSEVLPLSIRDLDRDKETGKYQYPEAPFVHRLRTALAQHSGIPVKQLLAEQEKRLPAPQRRELIPRQPGRQHAGNGNTPSVPTRRRHILP